MSDLESLDTYDHSSTTWANIKQIIPDFLNFVQHPYIPLTTKKFNRLAIFQWVLLLAVEFILIITIAFILLEPYSNYLSIEEPQIFEDDWPLWQIFLLVSIAAPLLEETIFRGWLRGTKRAFLITLLIVSISLSLSIISLYFSEHRLIGFTVLSFITLILASYITYRSRHDNAPISTYSKIFPFAFYLSAITFGIIHITNYEHENMWQLLPMIIPQTIGGLVLGYVRLNFGLFSSMVMHATSNGILVAIITLFPEV